MFWWLVAQLDQASLSGTRSCTTQSREPGAVLGASVSRRPSQQLWSCLMAEFSWQEVWD